MRMNLDIQSKTILNKSSLRQCIMKEIYSNDKAGDEILFCGTTLFDDYLIAKKSDMESFFRT